MPSQVVHATTQAFDAFLAKNPLVLVDFWAQWCNPCRMVGPIMDQLSEKMAGKAVIAKVNVDEEPELKERFRVESIPTVIIFKNGESAALEVGAKSLTYYENMLTEQM